MVDLSGGAAVDREVPDDLTALATSELRKLLKAKATPAQTKAYAANVLLTRAEKKTPARPRTVAQLEGLSDADLDALLAQVDLKRLGLEGLEGLEN